ncbi:TRZ/ATZ family hydrolase [Sphaerisporangium krabiense]|uniref:Cytosine/adenosine deaminase-related metal-dependent hydrolase n=1 Tax=Sphaerisporangium krabiense TaxID=763782 RepID=A0A7W9DVF0_9ACTN|nr:amidohydrolase family protein [Sphaerisporangium krabiense]MBB5631390.1 cytosine/adenosine deaminase-related metal-dependent hydrolase [Sphaerisporangium krabiense]GII60808.1 TRZ/ATZ family hydrolase [Sphaerisporangium krabiense]
MPSPSDHLLIRGVSALTVDDDLGDLPVADIEVRSGRIAAIGPDLSAPGAQVIDAAGMIAVPGFVDTHWHLWGTLLRGVVGDGPEEGWFARKGLLGPYFTPQDTYLGVRLAAAEGLAAGITTVHDWAHNVLGPEHADADVAALAELGVRARFSYGAPSAHPSIPAERMRRLMGGRGAGYDEAMDFSDVARLAAGHAGQGLVSVGVNVRGPARSAPQVYRAEFAAARELGLPVAMHCAGTRGEVERIRQVAVLDGEGLLGADLLLAHCLYLDQEDLGRLAAHGVAVTVSPLSELRLAMGLPSVLRLRRAGVRVSLSLDTTAIAASADPFQAMRVALGLANTAAGDAGAVTPRDILRVATLEGAHALGLSQVTGSLTVGKRADVVLIRTGGLDMAPVADPAVAVVHSAQPADVDTVLVDGHVRKRHGRLVGVAQQELVAAAQAALRALCGRAGLPWRPGWISTPFVAAGAGAGEGAWPSA